MIGSNTSSYPHSHQILKLVSVKKNPKYDAYLVNIQTKTGTVKVAWLISNLLEANTMACRQSLEFRKRDLVNLYYRCNSTCIPSVRP
jgi:hypothetical protein